MESLKDKQTPGQNVQDFPQQSKFLLIEYGPNL